VVSFMLRPLYPMGKQPLKGWMGHRGVLDTGQQKNYVRAVIMPLDYASLM